MLRTSGLESTGLRWLPAFVEFGVPFLEAGTPWGPHIYGIFSCFLATFCMFKGLGFRVQGICSVLGLGAGGLFNLVFSGHTIQCFHRGC